MKTTILYISSNAQNPLFEEKIMNSLVKNAGETPILWVTQVPVDKPGKNICVGKQGSSYFNEFRQVQIGLKAVTTPYITIAEADCLYPPEYLNFEPGEAGHCYRYENTWIQDLFPKRDIQFRFKGLSHFAQIIDTKLWLDHINKGLPEDPQWSDENRVPYNFQLPHEMDCLFTGRPAISFKTDGSLSKRTIVMYDIARKSSLDLWGSALELKTQMLS